jgi:hypothetical protein
VSAPDGRGEQRDDIVRAESPDADGSTTPRLAAPGWTVTLETSTGSEPSMHPGDAPGTTRTTVVTRINFAPTPPPAE